MITKQDVLEAIAECQGTRNPNANTAIKLAAFYILLDHFEDAAKPEQVQSTGYSYALPNGIIQYDSGTEFAELIKGRKMDDVLKVMDELMLTLQAMNKRLYDGVMRKLRE